MRLPLLIGLATLAACSSKKDDPAPPPPPAVADPLARGDAGVGTAGSTAVSGIEPSMHLDEDGDRSARPPGQPSRSGRAIDVTLRSTPPGAQVAVDGRVLGNTPTYWNGTADGREHEFVFTMPGYAIARYRFVPISSGVIHGRLEPIQQETDAGVPAPPPEVVPPQPPTTPSVNPPSAPPTIVPDAAAPVAPAPPAGSADSSVGPEP